MAQRRNQEPDKAGDGKMTVKEAGHLGGEKGGHKGGQRARDLIQPGKRSERGHNADQAGKR